MNVLHPSRSDSIIERLTAINPFQNPPKALLHIYRPLTRKITENMFTYLDGVETNIGFLKKKLQKLTRVSAEKLKGLSSYK